MTHFQVNGVQVPLVVSGLAASCGAWVIGGGADPDLRDPPRDWDVMVPLHQWHIAVEVVPSDAKRNSFGGWKFRTEDAIIDLWPDSLERLMTRPRFKYAWQITTGTRIRRL